MFHPLCDAGHYPGGLTLRLAFQEPREGPSHHGTGAKTPVRWTVRPGSPLPQPPVLPGSAESAGPSYGGGEEAGPGMREDSAWGEGDTAQPLWVENPNSSRVGRQVNKEARFLFAEPRMVPVGDSGWLWCFVQRGGFGGSGGEGLGQWCVLVGGGVRGRQGWTWESLHGGLSPGESPR